FGFFLDRAPPDQRKENLPGLARDIRLAIRVDVRIALPQNERCLIVFAASRIKLSQSKVDPGRIGRGLERFVQFADRQLAETDHLEIVSLRNPARFGAVSSFLNL